jgi:hypothetical protein
MISVMNLHVVLDFSVTQSSYLFASMAMKVQALLPVTKKLSTDYLTPYTVQEI